MLRGCRTVQENKTTTVYDKVGNNIIMDKLSDKQVKFVAGPCGNTNLKYVSYNIVQATDIEHKIWHK